MIDLSPVTDSLARIVQRVRDDQIHAPTPCPEMTVAALLDHVDSFCQAFSRAAAKEPFPPGPPPTPDPSRLGDDWRERIPARLDALAAAWTDPAAWEGMTAVSRLELPGAAAGRVAIDEAIVHGWDLAVATGQTYDVDDRYVAAAREFVDGVIAGNPKGAPGLFGPPVPVPDDASALHRLLGLTGRDPSWSRRAGG